jgi:hypothetical protein
MKTEFYEYNKKELSATVLRLFMAENNEFLSKLRLRILIHIYHVPTFMVSASPHMRARTHAHTALKGGKK